MTEKEIFDLINNIENDLVEKEIDDLLNDKNVEFRFDIIKEKAMKKIDSNNGKIKKLRPSKRTIMAVAIVASLSVTTVYGNEIYDKIQTLFNKSTLYDTVVEGKAYYLPEETKLNDEFTLMNFSVSKNALDISIMSMECLSDEYVEGLEISVAPLNDESVYYTVGGYSYNNDGVIELSLMNATENNYNIEPFSEFRITIGGNEFEVSLVSTEKFSEESNLVIANTENTEHPIINVAGNITEENDKTSVRLVPGIVVPDLKLIAFGEPNFTEYTYMFENSQEGIKSFSTGLNTKPIEGYDGNNNQIVLQEPNGSVGRPVTVFETNEMIEKGLLVNIPKCIVGYQKQIEALSLEIPKEGKVNVNTELDFILQKAILKSIERVSTDTAVVEFKLNTVKDNDISIINLGAYSEDVLSSSTTTNGDTAKMTIKFNEGVENVDFVFNNPTYVVKGNWSINFLENKNN